MRILALIFIFLIMGNIAFSQDNGLLLDDFEGLISGGAEGTVDFGAGGGSSIEVAADTAIKYSGNQSLKVSFDAVSGGYMWVARGFALDAKNATWLVTPQDIDWTKYNALSFYIYGNDSKAQIAFDIKDNANEIWRFMTEDNFQGWKQVICPFQEFFARSDWQPDNADKNANLDFPIKSFQFEPQPEAKGTLYFDNVELINK